MKHFMQVVLFVVTAIAFGSALVLAQEKGPGMMGGMSQQHGGMKGMDSMAVDKKMQELQQHEKMMEGIEDQKQLMTEMKKHMQMMTDMMGGSCCTLGGMSGKPDAPSGSGGMSEHQ